MKSSVSSDPSRLVVFNDQRRQQLPLPRRIVDLRHHLDWRNYLGWLKSPVKARLHYHPSAEQSKPFVAPSDDFAPHRVTKNVDLRPIVTLSLILQQCLGVCMG